MAIRAHFEHDLQDLQRHLLILSETVDRAIAGAVWALVQRDLAAARRVFRDEAEIDRTRYELEDHALRLIARQQPIARDLRIVSAMMGLVTELERIGDYAEGIAKLALRAESLGALPLPATFDTMAQQARDMLRTSMQAFAARDGAAADRLEASDDLVDALYQQILEELKAVMYADPHQCEAATYVLWAAHNLERIADRTVNIAERATYIATGSRP